LLTRQIQRCLPRRGWTFDHAFNHVTTYRKQISSKTFVPIPQHRDMFRVVRAIIPTAKADVRQRFA